MSWDTVKGIIKEQLLERFSKPAIKNLKYLAIDEISVRKGHKYVTLAMNLESGAIIFVGDGKGSEALLPFWEMLGPSRRRKIKAVATDLSPAYIRAVTENLPKAKLVFDHFHAVKLMNDQVTEIRRRLYHEVTEVLQKEALKGLRWILLKNPENLNEKYDEKQRIKEALSLNEPLAAAYYMKEDLRQIWSQPDKDTAASVLDGWIKTVMNSGIAPLVKMGKTLMTHRYGIMNWYDHPISSGPLEGTNNTTKSKPSNVRLTGFEIYCSSNCVSWPFMRPGTHFSDEPQNQMESCIYILIFIEAAILNARYVAERIPRCMRRLRNAGGI